MARATFKPNSKGIGAMLTSQKMEREMVHRARIVVSNAEAISPEESGEYVSSFDVESGQDKSPIKMGRGDRAWAKAKNTSGHAAAVEFGNARVGEGQRVLGRAADQVTSG